MLPTTNPAIYISRRDGNGSIISKEKVLQQIEIAIRTNWLSYSLLGSKCLIKIR